MGLLANPPRIKILEALSAVSGERIISKNDNVALVLSSDGSKKYIVKIVNVGNNVFRTCSTDNGTKYKRYVGYPIIALLMKMGLLPYDSRLASYLKDVPWRELNERYKKYIIVENIVKERYLPPLLRKHLDSFVKNVSEKLSNIKLIYDEKICEEANKYK